MIGYKMKALREQKGYSQEYMAIQCSIEQCSYSRIESGIIKPDIYKLKIIANVLGIGLTELLGDQLLC